ncbi:hypothetical protein AB0O20_27685 [Streptomyces kronopolitis]|uniref:hypothetical protein n=1 Tax=Streptomyces kronopolitis TaxID=1612435 RepID=UPI0034490C45
MSEAQPEQATEPGESGEEEPAAMSERTALIILSGVCGLVMWAVVTALPETAYVAIGVGGCLGWQRVQAWRAERGSKGAEVEGAEPVNVLAAVWQAVGDDNGALLTGLKTPLRMPDTKAVRALLAEHEIRVREGVRTRGGNGPGVKREDLPPLPSPSGEGQGGAVGAGQDANTNTNNIAVTEFGQGGYLARTDAEPPRSYSV